jgi:hypothetical protein
MMRKLLLTAVAAVCLQFAGVAGPANTGNGGSDLFNDDLNQVRSEFVDLNEIETIVEDNQGETLESLKASGALAETVNIMSPEAMAGDGPLGLPSFLWGCVLGWVGILITYLVTDDKDETKKALWGCVTGSAIYLVFYIIYVVAIVSSATTV